MIGSHQGLGMKMGLGTSKVLDFFQEVLDEKAQDAATAGMCTAAVLAGGCFVQNYWHDRIRSLRLAYRAPGLAPRW